MSGPLLLLIFFYYTLFLKKGKGFNFFKNIIQFGIKYRLF